MASPESPRFDLNRAVFQVSRHLCQDSKDVTMAGGGCRCTLSHSERDPPLDLERENVRASTMYGIEKVCLFHYRNTENAS